MLVDMNHALGADVKRPRPVVEHGSSRMSKRQIRGGHIVRIMNGPFTGFRGEVKEVDKLNSIAKVAVQVYGRVTPMDLPLEEIEPVSKKI